MLISSPHNLNLCSDFQDTRFLWNVFEAVQKFRSTCFIGTKTLGYASCFYTPIKHCCSIFKHCLKYIKFHIFSCILHLLRVHYELTKWPAYSWLDSSVGRALHQYHRCHGFESRSGLSIFQALISQLLKLCA